MGEYNGGTRKRVPTLTEKMAQIKDDHIAFGMRALGLLLTKYPHREPPIIEYHQLVRDIVRNAVAATELAVNEENRNKEALAAQRKQEAMKRTFHKPGRWGHG